MSPFFVNRQPVGQISTPHLENYFWPCMGGFDYFYILPDFDQAKKGLLLMTCYYILLSISITATKTVLQSDDDLYNPKFCSLLSA